MHRSARTSQTPPTSTIANRMRLQPAIHLCSGDAVGAFVECMHEFDDRPVFANPLQSQASQAASEWTANQILDLAVLCDTTLATERPIVLPIPACALNDARTIDACAQAIAQTRLCNQEISLELQDAIIAGDTENAQGFIRACRQRGFRVSIDARRSWTAELPGPTWLMIDTLRINAADIDREDALEERLEVAASAGVAIVAQRPYWRDGTHLAERGIDYGLYPRADA